MVKYVGLNAYLRETLQQAQNVFAAVASCLYLEDPASKDLRLQIALPDNRAALADLAWQTLQADKRMTHTTPDGAHLVYAPIIAYTSVTMGVLGILRETPFSTQDQAILDFVINQLALFFSNQQLLQHLDTEEQNTATGQANLLHIYEAMPLLEVTHDVSEQIEHVATTYQKLGWSPVRITLRNPTQETTEDYLIGNENIPAFPVESWLGTKESASRPIEQDYEIIEDNTWRIMLIPVRTSDDFIAAVITLYQPLHTNPPSAKQLRPLLIFSHHFGNALERNMLIQSLQRTADLLVEQVDELEFSRQADREISSRLDPDRIVSFTLDWALRRTRAEAGAIFVIDTGSQEVLAKETLGYPEDALSQLLTSPSLGIVGRCIREQRTQIVGDVTRDPDYIVVLPSTVTQLALPLLSNQRTIGAILLESKNPQCFDSGAIVFMERIVSMTAIALDNAQLLQQAEQMADDMSLIYNAGRTMSSKLDWDSAVQSIAQGMALAVRDSVALMYAYEAPVETAHLLAIYSSNAGQEIAERMPTKVGSTLFVPDFPHAHQAILQQKMQVFQMKNEIQTPIGHLFGDTGATAIGIVPLVAQGETLGLIILVKAVAEADFPSSEIFVAESLATQAAAIMRQSALYGEIRALETLKSEMIRMASHDLRAPLANIAGYMDLLIMDIEAYATPEIDFFAESIKRSIQTMENLVEDLLTLEKIESEKGGAEHLDFVALAKKVFQQHEPAAALKKQTYVFYPPAQVLFVNGNRTQLQQSVSNLISNAIKYTPADGQVVVRLYQDTEFPKRVYFSVEDNGYGISEKRQERIFQRFYRAKEPGTEEIQGTGLGLSMVKTIIERHNGRIWFTSEPGEGSTFAFWLPVAPPPLSTGLETTKP
ncbi:MAG: ATP-binding protein [Anaerolineales bacterium]